MAEPAGTSDLGGVTTVEIYLLLSSR